ncbi:hypothetical protein [Paenibacillus chitinolyticus]
MLGWAGFFLSTVTISFAAGESSRSKCHEEWLSMVWGLGAAETRHGQSSIREAERKDNQLRSTAAGY